jgi:hypothetical protein
MSPQPRTSRLRQDREKSHKSIMGRGPAQLPRGFIGPMRYFGYAGAKPVVVRCAWVAGLFAGEGLSGGVEG